MKSKLYLFTALLLIASALVGFWFAIHLTERSPPPSPPLSPLEPRQAKNFQLPDLTGQSRELTEWAGKVVVINFWASWCPPCLREIPVFKALQTDYGDQGLQIVGIAVEEKAQVDIFMQRESFNYPILWGTQSAVKVAEKMGNYQGILPYTVIINRQNYLVEMFIGEIDRQTLEPVILKWLATQEEARTPTTNTADYFLSHHQVSVE